MAHLTFDGNLHQNYKTAILVSDMDRRGIETEYVNKYFPNNREEIICYQIYKKEKGTTPVADIAKCLSPLLDILKIANVENIVVTNAAYFKKITGLKKAEPYTGYACNCNFENHKFNVFYCPSYAGAFYNPVGVGANIKLALEAVNAADTGTYIEPGLNIIHSAEYPLTFVEIKKQLQRLLRMKVTLSADIEAFSLKHYDAGIGTISFAWDKHNGIAFPVDLSTHGEGPAIRNLLKSFFIQLYKRKIKLIWHNMSYDAMVCISSLFMYDLDDTEGLLEGLEYFTKYWEDTQLISYLATNSSAKIPIGLKAQSAEFAGNYAEDVKDITLIPLEDLLIYNLKDTLCTHFVYEKHWKTVVADDQVHVYNNIFKPTTVDIIQMQLTGMPLDMEKVIKLEALLSKSAEDILNRITINPVVKEFNDFVIDEWVTSENARLITITRVAEDLKPHHNVVFNPSSAKKIARLLFSSEFKKLAPIEFTKAGNAGTGKKSLNRLANTVNDPDLVRLLNDILEYKSITTVLSTFIPPMLAAPCDRNGVHYLFGHFKAGGTVSGRLSSSNPNMQNIPSGGTIWGEHIKRCFKAPKGWMFVGLDFDSLEDKISALTTKDPNKLKVYTDGYDGHCLRAYSYYQDQFVGSSVDYSTVAGINSIKKSHPKLRDSSKAPTFLMTYQGGIPALKSNCGLNAIQAQEIYDKFHGLYSVSIQWVDDKIRQATIDGYVTGAFGLRIRSTMLQRVLYGSPNTPRAAMAEARTLGNALGQSWCLLNNRAATEFMGKVRKSKHRLDIRPCSHIHDAQYYLVRHNPEALKYVNDNLVEAIKWQKDPLIAHNLVKLSGELSLFFPTWKDELVIPNDVTTSELVSLVNNHKEKMRNEQTE
jgi:DNA polymerase-1